MKKILIILIIALAVVACGEKEETHTHTYSTTWSTDATQHWHECTANDGAKTDIAPHQWQWVETAPATTQAPGQETETCATCSETSGNTRPIAQLPDPNPTRTFTIVITGHEDHPVTVIDTRTGKNDTDLQKLGVISRLETAWNTKSGIDFDKVIGRGLVIVVEETTAYTRFKAYSGNRLGVNFTYISTDDEYISDRLDGPILSMSEMDTLG